jgi:hypothetical protein
MRKNGKKWENSLKERKKKLLKDSLSLPIAGDILIKKSLQKLFTNFPTKILRTFLRFLAIEKGNFSA